MLCGLVLNCLSVAMVAASFGGSGLAQFAYVTDYFGGVSGYTIDLATGALSPISGSPFPSGAGPSYSVALDPKGRFAYVTDTAAAGSIYGYTVNPSTGELNAITGSPFPAGINPYSMAVDPKGEFVYVADTGGDGVWAYTINPTTGALNAVTGSPFGSGLYATSVTVDPTGHFVYLANDTNGIAGYTIDRATGTLTAITGSPFRAGKNPYFIAVDPKGPYVYAADESIEAIFGCTIRPETGALGKIAGSPFPAGRSPDWVAVDPTGQFLYAVNIGYLPGYGSGVSGYTIDSTSGALTPISGSPFPAGTNLIAVALDPTGTYAYVTNHDSSGAGWVSGFAINPTTGVLTPIAGSPFPTAGSYPLAVAVAALQ
jgi:6-phosphogluconolactonase